MPKHIALLTAGHLSSCPRLIKEAELLSESGYKVSIVYLSSISTISKIDKSLIALHPNWNFYEIKWKNSFETIASKIVFGITNIFTKSRLYLQSTSKALIDKTLTINADLYIAHHPSVLVAAALAAEKYKSKYAYDIEDAFPFIEDGSFLKNPNKHIVKIEKSFIPNTVFTTTASPLYSDVYLKLYSMFKAPMELLNVFDIVDSKIEYKDRRDLGKVSFYWYSQTVGLNRGLQDLFYAINKLPENSFELHIRGMCNEDVESALLSLVDNDVHKSFIYFHKSVPTNELNLRNKEHDIGFALESGTSLNRELCISNKMFDYLRSGLMVVATDTKGHLLITNQLEKFAISYTPGDVASLAVQLLELIKQPDQIRIAKQKSFQLAMEKYNWSIQSENWIGMIKELLG